MRIVVNLNSFVAVTLTGIGLEHWQKKGRKVVPPLSAMLSGNRLSIRLTYLIRVFGPALAKDCEAFVDGDLTLLPDGFAIPLLADM